VSDDGPSDDAVWNFLANTSRTNMQIEIPHSVPPGSQIWICARWYNNRQQTGAASNPIDTYVQFGGSIQFTSLANAA
jgi:hypothetical protein